MYVIVDLNGNRLTDEVYLSQGDALVDAFMFPAGTFHIVPYND